MESVNEATGEIIEDTTYGIPLGGGIFARNASTLDLSVPANKVKMYNASDNAKPLNGITDPINVVDIMTEIGSKSQTHVVCQNNYLFTDTGDVFISQSNGITKSVNKILDMYNGNIQKNASDGYITVQVETKDIPSGRADPNTLKLLKLIKA